MVVVKKGVPHAPIVIAVKKNPNLSNCLDYGWELKVRFSYI